MQREIPLFKVHMAEKAAVEAAKVLNSGYIGQGAKVEDFENTLKRFFNHDYCLTLNSGTSGLHLALHLLKSSPFNSYSDLQPGDEVLTSPLTCTATNFAILANGFRLKWVDVDPHTLNMDLDDLERKITPKTKAIMLIHWGGYPHDLTRVRAIQQKTKELFGFEPVVIEDCAHSFGASYQKKLIGTHGNLCVFSFQAIKHLTCVDGGLLVVPHQELYKRGKLLRWYGIDRESNRKDFRCEADIPEWGYKFHMNDVAAAIGLENFKTITPILQRHHSNATFYRERLQSKVSLLQSATDRQSADWLFTIKVENRDGFVRRMAEHGIITSRVHERNDKHTCVKEFASHLPNLDQVVKEMVCLPVGWWVSDEDREYIVDCIAKGW